MRTLIEMVSNNQKVYFTHYQSEELWYITECKFSFPVPINDTGSGIFLAEDKASFFMRWINKQIKFIKEAEETQKSLV